MDVSNNSADHHQSLKDDASTIPLLVHQSHHQASKPPQSSPSIYNELRSFRMSLKWCGLDHSTYTGKFISYTAFLLLTVIIPTFSFLTVRVPESAPAEDPISFNNLVQIPESLLAIIAFFTMSRFFRTFSLSHLLFLDGLQDDSTFIQLGYARQLHKAFMYLAGILLPTFFLEVVHKIVFFSTVVVEVPYLNQPVNGAVLFLPVLASWVYRTGMFLLVCVLFRLTCELQIMRFEGLHKLLEGHGTDAEVIFEEHLRVRKQLSVTSHRYRFFIILCFVTITVSQLGGFLLVLESKTKKSFFNSGDLAICAAAQLSGFLLCLMGAARITHRAQRIVSVVTKWHMIVTSASSIPAQNQHKRLIPEATDTAPTQNETDGKPGLECVNGDKSDSPWETNSITVCTQELSTSFQSRQALVSYLQHNNGGVTLFGFALDRGLLHTIFAFETTLVLWILSKVVVLP